MPLYKFKCGKCGAEADEICSFAELQTPICSHCSLKMVRRYTPVHMRMDTFIDHDNRLAEMEYNGEFEPPVGSIAHEEKYGKQYFYPHKLPT